VNGYVLALIPHVAVPVAFVGDDLNCEGVRS
jgi:hypothetical protein